MKFKYNNKFEEIKFLIKVKSNLITYNTAKRLVHSVQGHGFTGIHK